MLPCSCGVLIRLNSILHQSANNINFNFPFVRSTARRDNHCPLPPIPECLQNLHMPRFGPPNSTNASSCMILPQMSHFSHLRSNASTVFSGASGSKLSKIRTASSCIRWALLLKMGGGGRGDDVDLESKYALSWRCSSVIFRMLSARRL